MLERKVRKEIRRLQRLGVSVSSEHAKRRLTNHKRRNEEKECSDD